MSRPAPGQPASGQPTPGQSAELSYRVSDTDTATALGSGDVPVIATPRLLAWLEAATVAALGTLPDGDRTSVGTRVELEHLIASPVGAGLAVRAELTAVDGRLLRFEVVAQHANGEIVAHGRITRVVVGRDRFLARLSS